VATHPRGVPLALLAVLAAALAVKRLSPRVLVASAVALAAVVVAVVAGAGVLDSTAGAGFGVRQFASYVWQFYLPRLPFMAPAIGPDYGARTAFIQTYYGVFASLEVRWREIVYTLLELASLASLTALAAVLWRARHRIDGRLAILLAAAPVILVAALHFAAYRNLQINPDDPIIVGRYLFPLLPLFGVAIAIVVRALPQKASLAAGTLLLTTGMLLGLSGLGMTAVRFYV
jgi:hypothetical protein